MMTSRTLMPLLGSAMVVMCNAATSVTAPACQCSAAPAQTLLTNVTTGETPYLAADPFQAIYAKQKDRAFVSFDRFLGVLDTSTFVPTLLYNITYPEEYHVLAGLGLTLTPDGNHVLVTVDGNDTLAIDATQAAAGNEYPVIGWFSGSVAAGASSIEVISETHYAYVAQEYGSSVTDHDGDVEVFEIHNTIKNNTVAGRTIGYIALGTAVNGLEFNADKSILYASSEQTRNSTVQCTVPSLGGLAAGSLSLLDTHALKHNTSSALISTILTGCGPVRIVLSPDHRTLWLTARESNHLLAYNVTALSSDPGNALVASVQVGTSPISLAFVRNGTRILTADSNRFGLGNATSGVSVVDVHAALQGRPAVLGRIATGLFPRDIKVSPDGNTALVSLYDSGALQVIDVSTLP